MWGSVLVLALLMGLSPVRLGLVLLVISRQRPVQNLLAYWVGGLMVGVSYMLVPLMVLHVTPWFRSFAHDLSTPATGASSTVRHIQIGMGVFVLLVAALMTVRFSARQRAHLPTPGGNTSTLAPISRLLSRAQDAPTEGRSAIRRLLDRARNAWENGSLWVAVVIGVFSGPLPEEVLIVLAIIVASGAAIGTQVSAVIAFVVGMLAVVEIILVSYLATPAKTQAIVQLVHDWALAHRRQVLVAMCAVVGVALVANGMSGV
jgi:hypothetical protein